MSPLAVEPRVSIVVLTHDRGALVESTVRRALAARPMAVIAVDNASSDDTAARLARLPVEVVRLARNLGAAGRNIGVQRATTPYVALADDDTWWDPDGLRHAADALDRHPRLAAVTARVVVGNEERLDPACAQMAVSPLSAAGLPGHAVVGLLAGAAMVRRSAFLEVGGFEPRFFLGGEEELLAVDLAAAGWRMTYLPDAVVHHHPSTRDGAGRRRLLARNALWCAWMRRPLPHAVARTLGYARRGLRDRDVRRGVVDAIVGLRWALGHRTAVPPDVQCALDVLDRRYPGRLAPPPRGPSA
jgi:N-acetylglucosaminyl-diphospho-decaprenol L-rhamnosyltransferase